MLFVAAWIFWPPRGSLAAEHPGAAPRAISPTVVTSFEQIWGMTEAETKQWHRLRLEFVVYYYDPLWSAMWGRSGEADSYLSVGSKPFPIKPGQRILVEGLLLPTKGMNVDEPKVTILADSVPVETLSTRGDIGNTTRFNKRLVTAEGYVNRQVARDANHQELELVVEGRPVLAQFLLKNEEVAPQVSGALVRVKGVYFARNEPTWTTPKLEIWVADVKHIEVLGLLARDESFQMPATPIGRLATAAPNQLVRVVGTVQAQEPGKSLTIRDTSGTVTFPTAQTQALPENARAEAIGYPAHAGTEWSLSQALYRRELELLTSIEELMNVPEDRKNEVHRIQLDFVVYCFDPDWKVLWGRAGETDTFLALGDTSFPLKPGQKIHLTGLIVPAKGVQIDEPKITVLADAVPLVALDTRGRIGHTENFDKHLVIVEGLVDRQTPSDPKHLEIDLVSEGRSVTAWLLPDPDAAIPRLEGAIVRVKGVYAATSDPTGALPKIEVWVAGNRNVEVLGQLDSDARFDLPATPAENLGPDATDTLVRVEGIVRMQQPGKSLTLRDETGQLTLLTAQTLPVQMGERVEAIGYAALQGAEWQLRGSLYRRAKAAPKETASGAPSALRLAEQVRELTPEEAARAHPVLLNGIVTWADPKADFFFVHDSSGGVGVIQPPVRNDKIVIGTKVTITGVSAAGRFTPVVFATSATATARMDVPEAKQVTLAQALTGIEDAQWVNMTGYLRGVTQDGPWGRLELTTSSGEFAALLPWSDQLAALRGAVVQLRGVCSVLTNAKRQLTGIQLWVPSPQYIAVEEAAPADPFSVATRSIASLRQFSSLPALNRRVRVAGVVVHQIPGQVLHIQEGTEGLLVLSRDPTPLLPGDRVEVVGFPGREGSRVVLREAIYRRTASGPEPVPLAIGGVEPIDVELDGRLVRLEAVLLDPDVQTDSNRLILQVKDAIFEAVLVPQKDAAPTAWVAGSKVAVTGVYQVEFDEYKRPHAVRLLLRSPQDVKVLSRPSWLTVRRALVAAGVLAVGVVLGFGWVIALRRRVERQTGQIREQVESEKAARLEAALARASKLESLGVLAGGIAHDFNNLLTVVMGNLSLAKLDPHLETETTECLRESERAAQRARDLTQQLITFAKGGEPVRAVTVLADVVREATQFALHGSKVRCDFDFAADAWPADVDKGQIGQVVHNIIINAVHAMPAGGVIRIALRNEPIAAGVRPALAPGRYLRLTVTDSGTGIAPEDLPRIFEPYFTTKPRGNGLGLATVYSIVKRHHGLVEVESTLGQGTTIRIWLPAVAIAPASAAAAPESPPRRTARVLFMDDEAAIRLVAGAMLKRMGLEFTTVADGAAVLREYSTARAEGRPYNLVMLDLTVPGGMGGAEAMAKLRELDPDVRAIVLSGYSSDPVMANYLAHGFCRRVAKPYEIRDLMDTVNEVLAEKAARASPPST